MVQEKVRHWVEMMDLMMDQRALELAQSCLGGSKKNQLFLSQSCCFLTQNQRQRKRYDNRSIILQ